MKKIITYFLVVPVGAIAIFYLCLPFLGIATFGVTTLYYTLFFIMPFAVVKCCKLKFTNTLLVYCSVVFSLFCAEVVLRYVIKKPVTYSERKKGRYVTVYDSPVNTVFWGEKIISRDKRYHFCIAEPGALRNYNSLGFNFTKEHLNGLGLRGKMPSKRKSAILTLGDSFTESYGAPKDSTYPLLLETLIHPMDSFVEVINAGVSGSDPFFEFKLLQKLSKEYHFGYVIFMVNTTDIDDVMLRGGGSRFLKNGSLQYQKAPFWEPLYAVSFVFRLVMHSCGYNFNLMKQGEEDREMRRAVQLIKRLFEKEIVPWAAREGIGVKVVLQPLQSEVKQMNFYYAALDSALRGSGVSYLNMRDSLVNCTYADSLYWPQDGHFNSRGYSTVARIIYNTFFRDSVARNKEDYPTEYVSTKGHGS